MLSATQKQLLNGFVAGRTDGREVVDFADEVEAARKWLPSISAQIEGKDLSVALRANGFNRAYEINGRKPKGIVYRRAAA